MQAIEERVHHRRRQSLRLWLKWILFPGLNVGTRKRMRLAHYLRPGDCSTLDAGCGNGAFSFHAARIGNNVLGINIDSAQIRKAEEYRNFIRVDPARCRFTLLNIYELDSIGIKFDQIICFETLEHLVDDAAVLALFRKVINHDGVLHICTPRRDRKSYFGEIFSEREDGGHVRLGYEVAELKSLLNAANFSVVQTDEVMGRFSIWTEELLNWLDIRLFEKLNTPAREAARTLAFLAAYPFSFLDVFSTRHLCVYVQAHCSPQA